MVLNEVVSLINSYSELSASGKRDVITQLVHEHRVINLDWGPGFTFKRARRLEQGQEIQSYTEFIWPPNQFVTAGRANSPGQPIMYLADSYETAFSEIRLERGNVLLSTYQIQQGKSIRILPVGELYFASTSRTGLLLQGDAAQMIRTYINNQNYDDVRRDIIVDSFIHDSLTTDIFPYEISSHICNEIFRLRPYVSAIAYPSAQRIGAINVAVQAEGFWNAWGVSSVSRFDAEPLAQGFFEISNRYNVEGISDCGTLVWGADEEVCPRFTDALIPLWVLQGYR